MFPTLRDKVSTLENTKVINPTEMREMEPQFLANSQLESMVKQETKSRHQRAYSTIHWTERKTIKFVSYKLFN